ncbi:hypothetical protein JXA32_05100 [Candidatus Sumerlaeota bacterium]|nr:hypothetical protein [Candidatus Sumerlaeota bacterium]
MAIVDAIIILRMFGLFAVNFILRVFHEMKYHARPQRTQRKKNTALSSKMRKKQTGCQVKKCLGTTDCLRNVGLNKSLEIKEADAEGFDLDLA